MKVIISALILISALFTCYPNFSYAATSVTTQSANYISGDNLNKVSKTAKVLNSPQVMIPLMVISAILLLELLFILLGIIFLAFFMRN